MLLAVNRTEKKSTLITQKDWEEIKKSITVIKVIFTNFIIKHLLVEPLRVALETPLSSFDNSLNTTVIELHTGKKNTVSSRLNKIGFCVVQCRHGPVA